MRGGRHKWKNVLTRTLVFTTIKRPFCAFRGVVHNLVEVKAGKCELKTVFSGVTGRP